MTIQVGIEGFALTRIAAAKINLALHVVGQRADGYHLLESLVTFADAGDRVGFCVSIDDCFTVSGPFAVDLPRTVDDEAGNLVLQARDLLRAELGKSGIKAGPVHLHLEKNLPVASGIGGGSADAAATLLGLLEFWNASLDDIHLARLALKLGADVPMCLKGLPLIARGIGDEIERVAGFPAFPMLIVNPKKPVSTPMIFKALARKTNPPLLMPQDRKTPDEWFKILKNLRNDLQPAANALEPAIGDVCEALASTGAAVVRMSGSGASCFGLFAAPEDRDAAAGILSTQHPNWYVLACNSVTEKEREHGCDD